MEDDNFCNLYPRCDHECIKYGAAGVSCFPLRGKCPLGALESIQRYRAFMHPIPTISLFTFLLWTSEVYEAQCVSCSLEHMYILH